MSSPGDKEKTACLERMEEMHSCISIPGALFSDFSEECRYMENGKKPQGA